MSPASRLLASIALPALLTPAGAIAADYDPPIYIEEAPEYVPVEIGSGWYLRGDVGYAIRTSPRGDFTYREFVPPAPGTYTESTFDSASLSERFSFGGGFGYHFNDFLRADVTLDRFSAAFGGTTSTASCDPVLDVGCRTEDSAEIVGYSAMINGYVDAGTIAGFTPYAGAGVGMTYVKWSDMTSANYCVDGPTDPCPGDAFLGTTSYPGADDWRFTYALMAGVAYDISNNMKLDVGYRYRNIAGGDMFGWSTAEAGAGATGVKGRDDGLQQHEIRVGLRYNLW